MIPSLLAVAIASGSATTMPTPAVEYHLGVTTSSPNPWLAAGLTYVSAPLGPVAAAGFTGQPLSLGPTLLCNPLPGAGHLYAGEPGRGWAVMAGGLALYLAAGAVYVWNYGGRSFAPQSGVPPFPAAVATWTGPTYMVTSALYSAWAAWDAYRIAEGKGLVREPGPKPSAIDPAR